MEALAIFYGMKWPIGLRWGLISAVVAMPLAYLALHPVVLAEAASTVASDVVSVAQVVADIALVIAAFVAILALRTQRETWAVTARSQRETWAATTLSTYQTRWDGDQMRHWRAATARALCQELTTGTQCDAPEYWEVLGFFEELGFFVNRGSLQPEEVWVWFDNIAQAYWSACRGRIELAQKDNSSYHEEFERLIASLTAINDARGFSPLTPAQILGLLMRDAGQPAIAGPPPSSGQASTAQSAPEPPAAGE